MFIKFMDNKILNGVGIANTSGEMIKKIPKSKAIQMNVNIPVLKSSF